MFYKTVFHILFLIGVIFMFMNFLGGNEEYLLRAIVNFCLAIIVKLEGGCHD